MAKITPADIVIRAQDKTKPGITSAKKGVGGLTSAVKSYGAEMAAVYLVVRQVASAMIQLSKEAAYLKQINMAFESMAEAAGESSEEMLEAMRELSGGTISTMEMIQSANRAMVLGLPIDKLDDMMKIARASATATGESVKKMFDDIVVGIGRQSRMILDNLGIIVKTEEANQDYAKAMGIVGRELTDVEKRQAFMNATLEAGEEIIKKVGKAGQEITSAERWQRMTAAITDLRAEMGMRLLPAFEKTTEVIRRIASRMKENLEINRKMRQAYKDLAETGILSLEALSQAEIDAAIKKLWAAKLVFESQMDALEISGKLGIEEKKLLIAYGETIAKLDEYIGELAQQVTITGDLIKKYPFLQKKVEETTDAIIEFDESMVMSGETLRDYIEQLDSAIESEKWLNEAIEETTEKANYASWAINNLRLNFEDLEGKIKDTADVQEVLNKRQEYAVGVMERMALSFEEGETIMKEMAKEGAAIVLEALGKILLAQAVLHWYRPVVAIAMAAAGMAAIAGAKYIQSLQQGGMIESQQQAGIIGTGYGGGDKKLVLAEEGEMMMRKEVVRTNRPALEAMNAGEQGMVQVNVYLGTKKIYSDLVKAIRNKQIPLYRGAIVD